MSKHYPKFSSKAIHKYISFFLATAIVIVYYLSLLTSYLAQIGNNQISTPSFLTTMIGNHIGMLIAWLFFLFKRKYWNVTYTLLLLVSLTPYVEFSNFSSSMGINQLMVDMIAFLLLAIHLATNPHIIKKATELFSVHTAENQSNLNPKTIQKFETRFESKSDEQLLQIRGSHEFSDEARAAATTLLKERKAV